MTNINGIHYEISKPIRNQKDGYYYQRFRQVDDKGNVVGSGDQMFRSARPDFQDGLFDPNWTSPQDTEVRMEWLALSKL